MSECEACEDDSPDPCATDREWQEYASFKLGIKLNLGLIQNARIYSFIFKRRFPKYAGHKDIDEAMDSNEWTFYAELEEQTFCVCTNCIFHLHQVRNSRLDLQLIIGSCCFDNYFNREAKRGRAKKKRLLKQMNPFEYEYAVLLVKNVTFKELYDSKDTVLSESVQMEMKRQWGLLWVYLKYVFEKNQLQQCKFAKRNQTFKDVLADKKFVNWARTVKALTGRCSFRSSSTPRTSSRIVTQGTQ